MIKISLIFAHCAAFFKSDNKNDTFSKMSKRQITYVQKILSIRLIIYAIFFIRVIPSNNMLFFTQGSQNDLQKQRIAKMI